MLASLPATVAATLSVAGGIQAQLCLRKRGHAAQIKAEVTIGVAAGFGAGAHLQGFGRAEVFLSTAAVLHVGIGNWCDAALGDCIERAQAQQHAGNPGETRFHYCSPGLERWLLTQ